MLQIFISTLQRFFYWKRDVDQVKVYDPKLGGNILIVKPLAQVFTSI